MPLPAVSCQRHAVIGLSTCPFMHPWPYTKSKWTQCLTNHVWEFHQIYNLIAVGDNDGVIRVWGQKVKSQGHTETWYRQIITSGGIFSAVSLSGMHGHASMKLITVTHFHVQMILMTFLSPRVQRLQTDLASKANWLMVYHRRHLAL